MYGCLCIRTTFVYQNNLCVDGCHQRIAPCEVLPVLVALDHGGDGKVAEESDTHTN